MSKIYRTMHPNDRLEVQLERLKTMPINEVITFTSKDKNLFKRMHKYRGENKISKSVRELIDLGLKSKGL